MDSKKLNSFKRLLERRQREIGALQQQSEIEEIQGYDSADLVDRAWVDKSKDLMLAMKNEERWELKEIGEALQRIGQKTYGVCERCGNDISENRLRAILLTRLCLNCKNVEEEFTKDRVSTQRLRPIDQEYIDLDE